MKKLSLILLSLPVWILLYFNLESITDFLIYNLLGMEKGTHLTETVWFFVFEVPKVLLLLVLIVFGIGIIRTYFSPERTRKLLGGKREFWGNILSANLGIVTPFCSCSAIPLFLGFVEAGIPLGVTFSFLIAAPMVNEVAIVLLFGLFGWETAALYLGTGLLIAIISGWVIGKLKLERYLEDWVKNIEKKDNIEYNEIKYSFEQRLDLGIDAVREIVGKVWLYVVIGIAVGAGVHGYVPQNFLAEMMGKSAWWSVPAAVLLGIPMYSNAAGIVPIVQALIGKGAALGTALAFMMSVIALSLPEMIILKKVLKLPLILTFIGVVGSGIILVGFIFNLIY
ncbi:MAG: permease [Melioribacteraceae bacterium]|nr:permease [Melioribacteraceae bacterium]